MIFVTRKAHFNAAHRLNNPKKTDAWNKKMFGKCNHPNWHGHNYKLEVTVAGEPDPDTGFVIDLSTLKKIIKKNILDKCDHKNLNKDVPFLEGKITSTENLVKEFFYQLKDDVENASSDGAVLYSVHMFETERNSAEFCPYRRIN